MKRNKYKKSFFPISETNKVIPVTVPNLITTWIITAFSINPTSGFAWTEQSIKLTVSQEFFISMDLPYSIKTGEILTIPISVFNNMDVDQEAEITMYNKNSDFDFVDKDDDDLRDSKVRKINVTTHSGASTSFKIRAKTIGLKKIKVKATSYLSNGDVIERDLLVKPKGITEHKSDVTLIDLRNNTKFTKDISINIPDSVPDSIKIEASITGDISGLTIRNVNESE